MTKWIETTGRSEEDAISAALFQLGLDRDDVSIEVLERAKSGLFGFGSKPARVRVSYEVAEDNTAIKADKLLETPVAPKVEDKKPAPAPVAEAEPVKQEPVQPVKVEAPQIEEEVVEETILAAKPDWKPAAAPKKEKAHREPRSRNQKKTRPERPENTNRLQDGDEVIIGKPERTPFSQAVTTPVSQDDEKAQKIVAFLNGLMEHLDVEATPEIGITEEGNYKVQLQGKGLGAIIGRRGETLDAIQQLTNYSVNRGLSKRVRVHIDAEGYRAKREESLQHLALKVAGKVVKYRKDMKLEPMNAYERHVIHAALQDVPKVTTYSTGVEPNRRTVVAYTPNK